MRSQEDRPDEAKVRDALGHIRDVDGYDTWLAVGMCLNDWDEARGLELWHEWSSRSTKYDAGVCAEKWDSFTPGGGLTIATLFKRAMQDGWKPSSNGATSGEGGFARGCAGARASANGARDHHGPEPAADDGRDRAEPGPTEVETPRPLIGVTVEAHEVIDAAVGALAADPDLYQRAATLVRVVREPLRAKGFSRPPGSPRIAAVPTPTLFEKLARFATWVKERRSRSGDAEYVPTLPPDWLVAGVAARADWPDIRPLEGVIEAPTLRPDGSVLDTAGYDEGTGLLFIPNAEYPPVPSSPTPEEARRAAQELLDLSVDFPFAVLKDDRGQAHRSAWLAAVLTAIARFAIDGTCPIFVFDATTPGAGKSLLCDLVALIATGRTMPRTDFPEENEELRKSILAVALAGDRLMMFDNVASAFGGPALDSALTAATVKGRVLGRTEMTPELPLTTVFFGNGNNLQIKGDILRRVVYCRLAPAEEHPEERDPARFAIKEPLARHVLKHRPRLVAAALTVLRAYVVAGRPDQELAAMDFREWSDLVRSAVHWATGVDPCASRRELVATDAEAADRVALVEGWAELPGSDRGLTTAEALTILKEDPGSYTTLRAVLTTRSGDLPSARSVGKLLTKVRGRTINGRSLQAIDAGKHIHAWRIIQAPAGGFGGFGGFPSRPNAGIWSDNCSTKIGESGGKQTHQTHQTHPDPEAREVITL